MWPAWASRGNTDAQDLLQHAPAKASVPGAQREAAPVHQDRSFPADWEQLSTVFSFLSSQTCLTNALQTPAIRREPKSVKTSWATSTVSAKPAGWGGSVTKVRPPQLWDRVEGVGVGTSLQGCLRICLPSIVFLPHPSLPHSGHSRDGLFWRRQDWGHMEVPAAGCPRIQAP